MGLFGNLGRMIGGFEEMQIMRQEERIMADEAWLMEGQMFDPYMHGQMFFDPMLGCHGTMLNGMWHPLDFVNGSWMFMHPSTYNVPRGYQPQNLMPPQQGYGGGYSQQPMQGGYPQPAPAAPQAQQGGVCSRCHTPHTVGMHFCASCGNDLTAAAPTASAAAAKVFCAGCGTPLAADTRFCSSCGRPRD